MPEANGNSVDLTVVACNVGLVMYQAEQLAEVVSRQVGVDDLDRSIWNQAPRKPECAAPHLQRCTAVSAAEVGDAQRAIAILERHPFERRHDQGKRLIDGVARAEC